MENWKFTNYRIIAPDFQKIIEKSLSLTINETAFSHIEYSPKPPPREFFYYSKTGEPVLIVSVDTAKGTLELIRGDKPYNTVFYWGLHEAPYNIPLPIAPTIRFSPEQARQIAIYFVSGGESRLRYPIKQDKIGPKKADRISLVLNQDKWLAKRHVWVVELELGRVSIDALTGQPLGLDTDPRWYEDPDDPQPRYSDVFAAPEPVTYPKPNFDFIPFASKEQVKEHAKAFCKVTFNDEELTLDDNNGDLHYPPIIHNDTALIVADYFPNFLIETKRDGDTITLQGQLKEHGKTAIVKLGSREATIDEKPFTLSGAPTEMDGRLYLPYELLQQCNGVLTRWEPKKKMLWVDTRFLRRD